MPRHARLVLPNVPLHIIQRGNNRQTCFRSEADYQKYLSYLSEHASEMACSVHAYVLMSNHVHLLISADDCVAPGAMMKVLDQRYAQYINWRYRRSGSLWDGRYKSCQVQQERYLLVCQRYIELNPVRAGMVDFPAQYRWSSYRGNAEGKADALLQQHLVYRSLGADAAARQKNYRSLFQDVVNQKTVDNIRTATNNNFALAIRNFCGLPLPQGKNQRRNPGVRPSRLGATGLTPALCLCLVSAFAAT